MAIADVPKSFVWVIKILLGLTFFLVVFMLTNNSKHENVCRVRASLEAMDGSDNGLRIARQLASCVANETGWAGSADASEALKILEAMPLAPCRYQGDWILVRKNYQYLVRLKAKGKFKAWPIGKSIGGESLEGDWGVFENKFIWMPAGKAVWPLDINKMRLSSSEDAFTLEELNGDFAHYFRLGEPVKEGCTDKP